MTHEAPIKEFTDKDYTQALEFIDLLKQLSDEDKRLLLRMSQAILKQRDKAKAQGAGTEPDA